MASMEKISVELKLADLQKDGLRKAFEQLQSQASSLLFLTFQWKDLEDHFESIRNWIQERSQALGSIEESIEKRFQVIKSKEEQFDSIQKSIDERFKELVSKEKRFQSTERLAAEEREKELDLMQKSIEERSKELEGVQRLIGEGFRELEWKEKRFRELQESMKERSVEFKSIQVQIKERFKELALKEKQLELTEECSRARLEEIELKEKIFEERSKEFELKEKRFEERLKDLELKEKRYEECSKDLKLKEKGSGDIVHSHVKSEAAVELPGNVAINNHSSANIQLPVTMDGKNLQMFLNKRWNEHDSMHDEVLTVLRQTSDPAKLVLDAMQGFYPLHLDNGNMDVEVSVIRRSCILLLEQLMKVSPEIRPHVKEGAMKLSFDWMTKMRPTAQNYLEVLGFLLLVASYGLVSAFDENELVSLLQIVAKHRQAPELCRVLGLADMMPYFINNLIMRKQNLDAIRFIYACELVDKFPPVPLLKDYMKFSKMDAKKLFMNGNTSLEAQNEATNKRISDLRAVIRCIEDHGLGCKDLYKNLEKFIAQLEQKMKNCTSTAPTPAPNGRLRQKNKKKLRSTTPSQVEIKQSTSDGTSWTLLPSKCVKKRDLAKFVLDKIKQLYPLNLEGDKGMNFIALKRCILSLEQLMNVSPQIKPHVKEEAMKFAVDWKVKLNEKIEGHSLYVLGFLQLLATYRLASSFDVDELLGLFYNIYRRKQAPTLFQFLGLTDKIPDFIQNLIEKEQQPLEAIRYIYKLKLVDKFSPIHILEDYLSHSKKLAEELCEKGNNSLEAQIRAIDKEVAALRAVVRCTAEYKLGPKYSPEILKERCEQLEKTKAGILKVLYSEGRGGPWSEYKSKLRQNQTRQSKRKCFSPTTTPAASTPAPSTSIIPTPGVAPEAQLQEQSGDKRPRISVSAEAAPCDSINATSTIHSIQQQQPCQQPAGLFTNHHEPYLTTSATQYSLSSFPPVNQNMRSYTQNSTPYYPPFRQPCNYNRPMLFNGPWDEHRAPGHHVGPAPFGSYGLPPPQYNPSSYP